MNVDQKQEPYMTTATGRSFEFLRPLPESVSIVDIARALSNICRFTGHVRKFYSVAQHSVSVAHRVWDVLGDRVDRNPAIGKTALRCALLHDAAEAYLGDIHSPLKQRVLVRTGLGKRSISEIESRCLGAVFERFDIPVHWSVELPQEIHAADRDALHLEAANLFPSIPSWVDRTVMPEGGRRSFVTPLSPDQAMDEFLDLASRLGIEADDRESRSINRGE